MNYVEIERVWRSPHNRPSTVERERDKQRFLADLRRRNRGFAIFITLVFTVLTVVTGRAVLAQLGTVPGPGHVDIFREWGAVLLLGLPWGAAIFFLREHLRHRRRHAAGVHSIGTSVRALLDENRLARLRLKWIAGLHGALLLLLPVVVFQLRAVGKAGDEILIPAFVIWPVIAVGILGGLRFHDRRTLRPRQQELEELLRSYE